MRKEIEPTFRTSYISNGRRIGEFATIKLSTPLSLAETAGPKKRLDNIESVLLNLQATPGVNGKYNLAEMLAQCENLKSERVAQVSEIDAKEQKEKGAMYTRVWPVSLSAMLAVGLAAFTSAPWWAPVGVLLAGTVPAWLANRKHQANVKLLDMSKETAMRQVENLEQQVVVAALDLLGDFTVRINNAWHAVWKSAAPGEEQNAMATSMKKTYDAMHDIMIAGSASTTQMAGHIIRLLKVEKAIAEFGPKNPQENGADSQHSVPENAAKP